MGTATGTPTEDVPGVSDSDMSHYFGVFSGDINTDGSVDILDAILGLQIINYIENTSPVDIVVDVNDDGQISIEEVLYALQATAGLKP